MRNPVYQAALEKAVTLKGGVPALAQHLRVHPSQLLAWRLGDEAIPGRVFFAVSEILTQHSIDQLRAVLSKPTLPA